MMILNCIPENYEIDIRIWNSFIGDAFDHYEDEKSQHSYGIDSHDGVWA